ncbi:hypothetical protein H4582DRAFT_2142317 [Lactarius indigo]|nr:hypothetical protein H4582DRAFT_2142317 [Lactarius indigo]
MPSPLDRLQGPRLGSGGSDLAPGIRSDRADFVPPSHEIFPFRCAIAATLRCSDRAVVVVPPLSASLPPHLDRATIDRPSSLRSLPLHQSVSDTFARANIKTARSVTIGVEMVMISPLIETFGAHQPSFVPYAIPLAPLWWPRMAIAAVMILPISFPSFLTMLHNSTVRHLLEALSRRR